MVMISNNLSQRSLWVRNETIALHKKAPETRIASSLSPVEIFVALYYGGVINFNPLFPLDPDRDRLVISKGHGSICMYPILADLGFFDRRELDRVCKSGGILGGIPDPVIPGYETINGSLGHGLGVAAGMALGLNAANKSQNVFVLCGDGELHEGACWEAIMLAGQHGLDNLNLIIDDNAISMLGYTNDIISHRQLSAKLDMFGWFVSEVDGHDVYAVQNILTNMKSTKNGVPKALIARTLKGRGIPSLENQPFSHIMQPSCEALDAALGDIE